MFTSNNSNVLLHGLCICHSPSYYLNYKVYTNQKIFSLKDSLKWSVVVFAGICGSWVTDGKLAIDGKFKDTFSVGQL